MSKQDENKVVVSGIISDLNFKATASGLTVLELRLEQTLWGAKGSIKQVVDISFYGQKAEDIRSRGTSPRLDSVYCLIVGRIQTKEFVGRDGNKRLAQSIIGDTIAIDKDFRVSSSQPTSKGYTGKSFEEQTSGIASPPRTSTPIQRESQNAQLVDDQIPF